MTHCDRVWIVRCCGLVCGLVMLWLGLQTCDQLINRLRVDCLPCAAGLVVGWVTICGQENYLVPSYNWPCVTVAPSLHMHLFLQHQVAFALQSWSFLISWNFLLKWKKSFMTNLWDECLLCSAEGQEKPGKRGRKRKVTSKLWFYYICSLLLNVSCTVYKFALQ